MPNAYGRAFTSANFLSNLAALKAINFGASDPAGVWFLVQNSTGNSDIWLWQPASMAATNETSVVRPDSVPSGSPGRCVKSLVDANSLGGILAAIALLNTAGLIERTADGGAGIISISAFVKTFLDDTNEAAARATLGLGQVNNTPDANKSVASAATLTTGRNINGVLFNGSANITINAVDATARIASSEKGAAGGVVPLNSSSKIDSIYIPGSYDDVLEFASIAEFPIAANAETGKIYIALDTNLTYRWTGTIYAVLDPSLALGTTSNTAYRGDLGNAAYQHSQITNGNPHGVTSITGNAGNVTGVVAIENGGTGSPSQNFVGLTGNQTNIGGDKTFTGVVNFANATPSTSTTTGAVRATSAGISGRLSAGSGYFSTVMGVGAQTIDFTNSTIKCGIGTTGQDAIFAMHVSGSGAGFFGFDVSGINSSGPRFVITSSGGQPLDFCTNVTGNVGADNLNNATPIMRIVGNNVVCPVLPTSSAGLPAGAFYRSGNTVLVV